MKIIKLSTTPVQWENEFSIARWEHGVVTEIEGKWIKEIYCINLTHYRVLEYTELAIEGTESEWEQAMRILHNQITKEFYTLTKNKTI